MQLTMELGKLSQQQV